MSRIIICTYRYLVLSSYLCHFIFFSCLITLVKTSRTMLITSEVSRILVLFLILMEMLWVFSNLGWCWLHVFYMLPLLCWAIYCVFLFFSGLLLYIDVGFWEKPFMYLLRWWGSFYPWFNLYSVLQCLLVYICWSILNLWHEAKKIVCDDLFHMFLNSICKHGI